MSIKNIFIGSSKNSFLINCKYEYNQYSSISHICEEYNRIIITNESVCFYDSKMGFCNFSNDFVSFAFVFHYSILGYEHIQFRCSICICRILGWYFTTEYSAQGGGLHFRCTSRREGLLAHGVLP